MFLQEHGNFVVATPRSNVESRFAIGALQGRICTVAYQYRCNGSVPFVCSSLQWREPLQENGGKRGKKSIKVMLYNVQNRIAKGSTVTSTNCELLQRVGLLYTPKHGRAGILHEQLCRI